MRSTTRATTAVRVGRALIGLGTVAGFALVAPGSAYAADPAGCVRSGENVTCTAGVPAGQVLDGTANANTITITGGSVAGTIRGLGGNDTIIITGTAGLNGATGPPGANGTAGTPAGTAGGNGGVGTSAGSLRCGVAAGHGGDQVV